ncbi:MAG: hypothetical protein MI924_11330, partial [Chloroflexales bacterium]|nr:hypothetical protein [Chloroflexales bacterium]
RPLPTNQWGRDEFIQAAIALTNRPQRYGFATTQDYGFDYRSQIDGLLRLAGMPLLPPDPAAAVSSTDPQVVQAAQTFLTLMREASPYQQLYRYGQETEEELRLVLTEVSEGRAALWFSRSLYWNPEGAFATGIRFPPYISQPLAGVDYRLGGLYISAQSLHAEACWTWLKHLSADLAPYSYDQTWPVRRSVVQAEAFRNQFPDDLMAVYDTYWAKWEQEVTGETGRTLAQVYQQEPYPYWFYRALDRALQGADVQAELAEAQRLTDAYFACAQGLADRQAVWACAQQVDPQYEGRMIP